MRTVALVASTVALVALARPAAAQQKAQPSTPADSVSAARKGIQEAGIPRKRARANGAQAKGIQENGVHQPRLDADSKDAAKRVNSPRDHATGQASGKRQLGRRQYSPLVIRKEVNRAVPADSGRPVTPVTPVAPVTPVTPVTPARP